MEFQNQKSTNPPTYTGNVQNKDHEKLVGEIHLWKQEPDATHPAKPEIRGWLLINTEKLQINEQGYAYIQVSLWKPQPEQELTQQS